MCFFVARRKSFIANTHKSGVMCFNFHTYNLPPLNDGVLFPYTETFKLLGMVCVASIDVRSFLLLA